MNNLVQIKKKNAQSLPLLKRLEVGPIVDKFFLLASISSFSASAYLGTHMWLMVQGQTPAWQHYYALRELHAIIQIYVFFGLFITGFLFQAAPKVFDVSGAEVSRAVLILPITVITGVVLTFDWFYPFAGRVLISLSFLAAALALFPIIRKASYARIISIGIPILISFAAFAIGAFLPLSRAVAASLVIWVGVVGAIFGASQQFVAGFLDGKKMDSAQGLAFLVSYLCSSLSFIAAFVFANNGNGILWTLTAGLCGLSVVLYALGSKSWKVYLKPLSSALSFAIACGIIWALIGCLQLSQGGRWIDLAIHSWALGWGVPLILAVSLQIIGFLSGKQLLSEKSKLILLVLWLPVPLFRTVFHTAPPIMAWVITILATVVLVVWIISLLRGIKRILQRQLQIKEDETLMQC